MSQIRCEENVWVARTKWEKKPQSSDPFLMDNSGGQMLEKTASVKQGEMALTVNSFYWSQEILFPD